MQNRTWVEFKDTGYFVSDFGEVKSCSGAKPRILKQRNDRQGYPRVNIYIDKKCTTFKIATLVAMVFLNHSKENGLVVDHIDNDKSNNKLSNLQLVSVRKNSSKDKKGVSKYTGVSWCKLSKKWKAQIHLDGKKIHLGIFKNELDASKAYQNRLKANRRRRLTSSS